MVQGVSPREQVDALTGAVEDLAGQFSLQPLLHRILRRAIALLGGDAGSISTVDEEAGTYHKEVDIGVECQEGRVFPLTEGATGAVVARRGPAVFDSYSQVPGGHVVASDRSRLHATAAVPIEWGGSVIGACVVFSTSLEKRFSEDDVAVLSLFAKHAAIAITNARMHAEAADRARRLAVAEERERVVRDVHDTVTRALGSILVHLEGNESPVDQSRVDAARAAARQALVETRRTALGLVPALLEHRSLHDALGMELAWVRSISGLRTDLVVTGDAPDIAPEVSAQALQMVQEALTNVVAHAEAALVRVGVFYGSDDVVVVVEDDGAGFDVSALKARRGDGLGLNGIVARANQLAADLEIESNPGWGTRVRARVPYDGALLADRARRGSLWRVLVVNHRAVVRAGLVRLLGNVEAQIQVVGEVGDARDVVDAVRVLEPDVVLIELRMPGLDGARLTSYVRASDPDVAVLLMADDDSDGLLREAISAGARGCVTPDIDGPGLARAVLASAHGDVQLSENALLQFARRREGPAGEQLTGRERQVRALVERGLQDKQIAAQLGISTKTVEKHVGAVLRKTHSPNRTALAHRAAVGKTVPDQR
jgi:signal transduction histidine kinase/DNA-binding NarL/FixJ family response regulator